MQHILNYINQSFFGLSMLCRSAGWINVNLLYLPDSTENTSLEGLTLWCPEIKQSKQPIFIA